jgi:hypothetical protein
MFFDWRKEVMDAMPSGGMPPKVFPYSAGWSKRISDTVYLSVLNLHNV